MISFESKPVKRRIISATVSVAVTAAIVGSAIFFAGSEAYAAKATLRGIQELANIHSEGDDNGRSPMYVIEVVDTLADAKMGYLVGGEEPVYEAKSIKDMPSKVEREARLGTANPTYLVGDAYLWNSGYTEADDGEHSCEIRGDYSEVETAGTGYYAQVGSSSGYTLYTDAQYDDNGTLVYFDADGNGDINDNEDELGQINAHDVTLYRKMSQYNLSNISSFGYMPIGSDVLPIKDSTINSTDPTADAYNWQYFKIANNRYTFESLDADDLIYQGPEGEDLQYKGTVVSKNTEEYDNSGETWTKLTITDGTNTLEIHYNPDGDFDHIGDGSGNNKQLFGIDFSSYTTEDISSENLHTMTEITRNDSAEYVYRIKSASSGLSPHYSPIDGTPSAYTIDNCPSEKGPYFVGEASNGDYSYSVDGSGNPTGDYNFTADYTQSVRERFRYNYGFSNNEWFKKHVMDRDDDECDDLSVDVITVTADKLTIDLINKADLLYFNYSIDDNLNSISATHDITGEVAKAIVDKAKASENEESPSLSVMLEYAVYMDSKDGGMNNLFNTVLELMQSTVSIHGDLDTSGNYVIDPSVLTTLDSSDGYWYGDKDPTNDDISYVNNNIFVNDNIKCGQIIAADFKDTYSDEKLGMGFFSAVESENEAEARYIELQSQDPTSFNKSVSKATSIRYILNKKNNRVVDKASLKVLDIEPYDFSQYQKYNEFGQGGANDPLSAIYYNPNSDRVSDDSAYKRDLISYEINNPDERDHITGHDIDSVSKEEHGWIGKNLQFKNPIEIDMIGTKEFVAINDDLKEYDLIYIGMDKAMLNTDIDTNTRIKSDGETKYNNSSMNGLVYTHMGDEFAGFDNVRYGEPHGDNVFASGNDITPKKVKELKEYIMAGYAVILSDGFFDDNGNLNTTTVDKESRMAELMRWLLEGDGKKYVGRNVMRKSDLEINTPGSDSKREIFNSFLGLSKLEITMIKQPTAYDGSTQDTRKESKLEAEDDGQFYLRYTVRLSNNSIIDTGSATTYDCNLYIDMDSDGDYEELEELDGLEIEGGNESDGKFQLMIGKEYKISRIIPEEYVGFLPWKLEFVQNGSSGDGTIRKSVTGFAAVPKREGVATPVVNVLQLLPPTGPGEGQQNNLDLADADMKKYYEELKDEFIVNIYQMDVRDYILKSEHNPDDLNDQRPGQCIFFEDILNSNNPRKSTDHSYGGFLAQFDIVVLGFADNYSFYAGPNDGTNYKVTYHNGALSEAQVHKDAVLGIREYTMAGGSMLFTHDLTHSNIERTDTGVGGYYLTVYLRDLMGMDRYGYSAKTNYAYEFDKPGKNLSFEYDKDTTSYKSGESDKYGFTDAIILTRIRDKNGGYNTGYPNARYGLTSKFASMEYDHSSWGNETIQSINRGQITEYPYKIAETEQVARTHSQYYQLNFETKPKDNSSERKPGEVRFDDEVVVWYALSNETAGENDGNNDRDHRFYRALYKDARNNYYIYTKGNITYTGAGHSVIDSSMVAERKLFVNTLLAAYNSGKHSPRIVYKENPWDTSATITCTYVPYDQEYVHEDETMGGFLDDYLIVNFKTMNSNMRSASNGIYARYYTKDPDGSFVMGGEHYKEISPVSIELVTKNGSTPSDAYFLNNFRIYQAKFKLSDFSMSGSGKIMSRDNAKLYIRVGMNPLEDTLGESSDQVVLDESMNELDIYATRLFNLE